MNPPKKTRLAYLTTQDRQLVLNLQTKPGELKQFEITEAQLVGIVLEGVRVLVLQPNRGPDSTE